MFLLKVYSIICIEVFGLVWSNLNLVIVMYRYTSVYGVQLYMPITIVGTFLRTGRRDALIEI